MCVRTWVVPDATIRCSSAVMCSTFGSPSSPRRRRSSAMRSARAGPAECGTQGPPNNVLSRWQCASMRPGSSRRPGTSTTSTTGSARRSGPIRSMTPSRTRTSAGASKPHGRPPRNNRPGMDSPNQMAISAPAEPSADVARRAGPRGAGLSATCHRPTKYPSASLSQPATSLRRSSCYERSRAHEIAAPKPPMSKAATCAAAASRES